MGNQDEKTDGFSIDSGFMSDAMRNFFVKTERNGKAENCHVVLLKEGIMTQVGLGNFFKSIPTENIKDPFVFIMNPNFNPNTRLLIDALIKNQFKYQFIFINETKPDDIYMDVAAVTGGTVQDASNGVGDYLFEYCGKCDKITIEIDKTIFINNKKNPEVARCKVYKEKLKRNINLME